MNKIIAAILLTLTLGVSSAVSSEIGFQFSYTTEPDNSYIIYANNAEFCWFGESDTVVDLEAETPSGLPLHTVMCEDILPYGDHTLYMTAIQYGIESLPSEEVVFNKRPTSSEVLIPVIIKMFRDVIDNQQQ